MREEINYTPPWLELVAKDDPDAQALLPVFTLRMGTILEREALDADLEGRYRARQVPQWLMLEAAVRGVRALLETADAEQVEEMLRSAHAEDAQELDTAEREKVREVEEILSDHWPEYRQLTEQNARHDRTAPVLAFQRFCTGWQNVKGHDGEPVEFERNGRGEIPDALLRRLPPVVIRAVGFRAFNLQYGVGEAKN